MASYNKVILVGNLTRDPEIRYISSGAATCKFAIAVNRKTREKDEVMFVDIVAWEKLAETCNTYLKKGAPVLVDGRLSIRQYEDKQGQKRKATEVVISAMQMLGKKGDEGESRPAPSSSSSPSGNPGSADDIDLDDEVPF